MCLCQRNTGEKLKDIGIHFGIGASGVSQSCRRVAQKIEIGKKLKRKINKIEKKINLSKMKTPLSSQSVSPLFGIESSIKAKNKKRMSDFYEL